MKSIKAFAQQWNMLPAGARVLCAVSGGADSVCLLHLLKSLSGEMKTEIAAAHFEHGIRGEESLRDMRFVERICSEWNVPLFIGHADVPAVARERSAGIEETARELRYDFLFKTAREEGFDRIATAHNANDNAETVLFNLTRGTGISGLCGIPPVRDEIIRPLLNTTRAEIERYLEENALEHTEDSTNADTDYSRNRIRKLAVPVLREINPAFEAAVFRTGELLRADNDYLDSLADDFIEQHYSEGAVPLKKLAALPTPVKARVIRKLCPKPLGFVHVSDIEKLAEGTELAYLDVPGARIRRQRGKMYFTDPPVPKKNSKKV